MQIKAGQAALCREHAQGFQGLGTGTLFTGNFKSPLEMRGGELWFRNDEIFEASFPDHFGNGENRERKSLSVFPNDSSAHLSAQMNVQQLNKCTGLNRLTLQTKQVGATTENLSNIQTH